MPSTCQTIHYNASQYIVYTSSLFFTCNTKSSSEVSLPSLLASLTPPLLLYSLGCSLPPRSLLPSFPRYVHALFRPFLARSVPAWYLCMVLTVWRRLLLTLPQPSLPTSTPAPSLSHIIAPFLPPAPCSLPPSLPPSILPRPFPVSHHRFLPPSLPPAPCSLGLSQIIFSLSPSLPLAARLPPAVQLLYCTPCVYTVLVSCTGYCVGRAQPGGVTQPGVALRQWSGRAISRWLAVTLATHPHDESVFDE